MAADARIEATNAVKEIAANGTVAEPGGVGLTEVAAKVAAADPLAALRDIHLPPDPSLWPPAPGWWILLALACVLGWRGVIMRRRWLAERNTRKMIHDARDLLYDIRRRHQGGAALEQIAAELSVLVRRIALTLRPRTEVAGLCADAWLDFLARSASNENFRSEAGQFLLEAPYRRSASLPSGAAQAEQCFALVDEWIERLGAPPKDTTREPTHLDLVRARMIRAAEARGENASVENQA